MQLLASAVLSQPVLESGSGHKVARVKHLILDPATLRVEGLLVSTGPFLFEEDRALSFLDILNIFPQGVAIEDKEVMVETREIVRLHELLKKRLTILGQLAVTKSGVSLGRVTDLLFDSQSGTVSRLHIKSFLRDLILPSEKVETISRKAVVFRNDVLEEVKQSSPSFAAIRGRS